MLKAGSNDHEGADFVTKTRVLDAVRLGDVDKVRAFLQGGGDANLSCHGLGRTLLHIACRQGYAGLVSLLLSKRANPGARTLRHLSPLHLAANEGHLKVARLLLESWAPVDDRDQAGNTPLHLAAQKGHMDVVRLLLQCGADKNGLDESKWTPLHSASWGGHAHVVRTLLQAGAKAKAADVQKFTPLHAACHWGHPEVAKVLLEFGADPSAIDSRRLMPDQVIGGEDAISPKRARDLSEMVICHRARLKGGNGASSQECVVDALRAKVNELEDQLTRAGRDQMETIALFRDENHLAFKAAVKPECPICQADVKDAVLEPCRHLAACLTCADTMSSCPFCSCPVAAYECLGSTEMLRRVSALEDERDGLRGQVDRFSARVRDLVATNDNLKVVIGRLKGDATSVAAERDADEEHVRLWPSGDWPPGRDSGNRRGDSDCGSTAGVALQAAAPERIEIKMGRRAFECSESQTCAGGPCRERNSLDDVVSGDKRPRALSRGAQKRDATCHRNEARAPSERSIFRGTDAWSAGGGRSHDGESDRPCLTEARACSHEVTAHHATLTRESVGLRTQGITCDIGAFSNWECESVMSPPVVGPGEDDGVPAASVPRAPRTRLRERSCKGWTSSSDGADRVSPIAANVDGIQNRPEHNSGGGAASQAHSKSRSGGRSMIPCATSMQYGNKNTKRADLSRRSSSSQLRAAPFRSGKASVTTRRASSSEVHGSHMCPHETAAKGPPRPQAMALPEKIISGDVRSRSTAEGGAIASVDTAARAFSAEKAARSSHEDDVPSDSEQGVSQQGGSICSLSSAISCRFRCETKFTGVSDSGSSSSSSSDVRPFVQVVKGEIHRTNGECARIQARGRPQTRRNVSLDSPSICLEPRAAAIGTSPSACGSPPEGKESLPGYRSRSRSPVLLERLCLNVAAASRKRAR